MTACTESKSNASSAALSDSNSAATWITSMVSLRQQSRQPNTHALIS